jgi:hypothetical protein
MVKKKSETEVLFPGMEIGGFKIKPWTFEQFLNLIPALIDVSTNLKEAGIKFENIEKLAEDPKKLISFFSAIKPAIPQIVAESIGLEVSEVKAMDFDDAASISLVVLIMNAEKIKNFSGLGKTALKSLATS